MWEAVVQRHGFLSGLAPSAQALLKRRSADFLASKEFSGAQGLTITDEMAVTVAAQAVLPVLDLGLAWYDDFVGIVIHPDEVLAERRWTDELGVVHEYDEALAGESLDGGPIMLSWRDVAGAAESAAEGYNVVIHEFVHKLDQRDGVVDGCPPLASRAERARWRDAMDAELDLFRERVAIAERFGGEPVWLDPYAATDLGEFFATSAEAYFVNRARFALDFPELLLIYDRFFHPASGR